MKIFNTILKTLGISEEEIQQALTGTSSARKALPAAPPPAPRRESATSLVYLLLDTSGSMEEGDKFSQARKGGRRFAEDAIRKGYAVGVIRFSDAAEVSAEPTKNIFKIKSSLAIGSAEGSTNMAAAIELAAVRLATRDCDRTIVLVTDGFPDNQEETLAVAEHAKHRGITIIAIGTDDADREFLARIASATELSRKVEREELQLAITDAARLLPAKSSR